MGGDACVIGSWPSAGAAAPRVKPPANVAPLFRSSRRLKRFEPIGLSFADEPTRKSLTRSRKYTPVSGPNRAQSGSCVSRSSVAHATAKGCHHPSPPQKTAGWTARLVKQCQKSCSCVPAFARAPEENPQQHSLSPEEHRGQIIDERRHAESRIEFL